MGCPVRSRYPNEPPRSFIVLQRSNDDADCGHLSKFKPLALGEIHAADDSDRRHNTNAIVVRVIEYCLDGVADAEPIYRLVTSILDHEQAPAQELAALYHERWEIETTLDELKTHLRGAIVLRSKTPDLVRQEFYGLIMAHYATRGLMHEAALKADTDPDRLSFVHAVRVIRRKLPQAPAIPPSPKARLAPSRAQRNSPGALASTHTPPQQTWRQTKDEQLSASTQI
jgi:DDE family transposase